MQISQEPEKYFDHNQYLLADSAYASGQYVIPAYRTGSVEDANKINFNYHLAQSRVQIEHAIGVLKGRWASLQEMRNQLQTKKDMKDLINWVVCCTILHNLLADLKDEWNELFEGEAPEPSQSIIFSSSGSQSGLQESILPTTLAHFNQL